MFFHVEERRIWLRTHTHTVVSDHDPDFPRFVQEPNGRVARMLRIWLAEHREARPYLRAYLGTVTCGLGGPSYRELRRLLRLATKAARGAGQPARASRRRLVRTLRGYTQQHAWNLSSHQAER